jgi:hypothetical protein
MHLKKANELPALANNSFDCVLLISAPVLVEELRSYIKTHGYQPGARGAESPGN